MSKGKPRGTQEEEALLTLEIVEALMEAKLEAYKKELDSLKKEVEKLKKAKQPVSATTSSSTEGNVENMAKVMAEALKEAGIGKTGALTAKEAIHFRWDAQERSTDDLLEFEESFEVKAATMSSYPRKVEALKSMISPTLQNAFEEVIEVTGEVVDKPSWKKLWLNMFEKLDL
eukprot:Nk52_evm34s153 gene=Nk52_evmTU34s153